MRDTLPWRAKHEVAGLQAQISCSYMKMLEAIRAKTPDGARSVVEAKVAELKRQSLAQFKAAAKLKKAVGADASWCETSIQELEGR